MRFRKDKGVRNNVLAPLVLRLTLVQRHTPLRCVRVEKKAKLAYNISVKKKIKPIKTEIK